MTRKTHLVGTWPGWSGAHAMDTALSRLGPHLLRMTDGETGERSQWIMPTVEWMRANPDVDLIRDGAYTSMEDTLAYRVREGRSLDPANISLGYALAFRRSYPAFQVLRERHGHPEISFQIGIPNPGDLAIYCFGEAAMADHSLAQAFTVASVEQIREIFGAAGTDVIFQIESVVPMVAVAQAPPEAQPAVAEQFASAIVQVPASSPEGARFGAHICLGDFQHKAFAEMTDASALVTLANALARLWPKGRPLEYIHAPFAAADKPGSFDESWYAPLAGLELPDDVRFVAGFIHESIPLEKLRELAAMIERYAGRQVDVAAACGLGRRPTPDQAWDAMDKAAALIETAD